jgi:O-antigen ligase
MGMILTIDLFPRQWRLLFSLFTFIGIIVTFSRGAILLFPVIFIYLIYKDIVPRKQSAIGLFSLTLITIITGFSGDTLANLPATLNIEGLDPQRLDMLINPESSLADDSANERQTFLLEAWKLFLEHPFVGNGAGYIKGWEFPVGPHNMYVLHMAEHGFLGLFLYPTFLLTSFWGSRREAKDLGIALLILMLPWGLFSHAILYERNALLIFSFLSVMNAKSQMENLA